MSLEEGLIAFLIADATISPLVGSRVYDTVMPDSEPLPAISLQRVGTSYNPTLNLGGGLDNALIQIDIFTGKEPDGLAKVRTLAKRVVTILDGLRSKTAISGVDVQSIIAQNDVSLWETDVEEYRRSLTFSIQYRERV